MELDCIRQSKAIPAHSSVARLLPFIGQHDLLRVGGRLENSFLNYDEKHPILLPNNNIFVKRLIEETHRKTLHRGVQLMQSSLNRVYWITRGLCTIQGVFRRCLRYARFAARPVQQQMAALPAVRIKPARTFAYTGSDYAGPFPMLFSRGRGAKKTKGYIAIFVCMVVKAVHIKPVSDLTSIAFLAAYRRFTARRGRCRMIFSNNGTAFTGAAAENKRLFAETSKISQEVAAEVAMEDTSWSFIPPRASHFGGLWEAAVKSFKHHFKRVIGDSALTFEEMSTVAVQIEACMISRPLCPMSNDAAEAVALTPGHFLIGEPLLVMPEPFVNINLKQGMHDRWRILTYMRNHFWDRWRREILHHLQQRNKWLAPTREPCVGDLVLIKDDLCGPSKWPLGRIIELHPGRNGLTRVVSIKSTTTVKKRPVVKTIYLPMDNEALKVRDDMMTILEKTS